MMRGAAALVGAALWECARRARPLQGLHRRRLRRSRKGGMAKQQTRLQSVAGLPCTAVPEPHSACACSAAAAVPTPPLLPGRVSTSVNSALPPSPPKL